MTCYMKEICIFYSCPSFFFSFCLFFLPASPGLFWSTMRLSVLIVISPTSYPLAILTNISSSILHMYWFHSVLSLYNVHYNFVLFLNNKYFPVFPYEALSSHCSRIIFWFLTCLADSPPHIYHPNLFTNLKSLTCENAKCEMLPHFCHTCHDILILKYLDLIFCFVLASSTTLIGVSYSSKYK